MISPAAQLCHTKAAGVGHNSIQFWHQQVLSPRPQPNALLPVLETNRSATFQILLQVINGYRPRLVHPIIVQKRLVQRPIQLVADLSIINVGNRSDGGLQQEDENQYEHVLEW